MKLILAGSRNFDLDIGSIQNIIDIIFPMTVPLPTEVVCGCCKGIDLSGANWAEFQGIPIKRFKPDWDGLGRKAGPIRNQQMAEYGNVLLLVWDGKSKGSANMKKQMEALNKPVYEIVFKGIT